MPSITLDKYLLHFILLLLPLSLKSFMPHTEKMVVTKAARLIAQDKDMDLHFILEQRSLRLIGKSLLSKYRIFATFL